MEVERMNVTIGIGGQSNIESEFADKMRAYIESAESSAAIRKKEYVCEEVSTLTNNDSEKPLVTERNIYTTKDGGAVQAPNTGFMNGSESSLFALALLAIFITVLLGVILKKTKSKMVNFMVAAVILASSIFGGYGNRANAQSQNCHYKPYDIVFVNFTRYILYGQIHGRSYEVRPIIIRNVTSDNYDKDAVVAKMRKLYYEDYVEEVTRRPVLLDGRPMLSFEEWLNGTAEMIREGYRERNNTQAVDFDFGILTDGAVHIKDDILSAFNETLNDYEIYVNRRERILYEE